MGRIARFLRDTRAATALEFAMLMPVLLLIIAGVFEYSRILLAQHMVRDIVDEAVRAGVVKNQSKAAVQTWVTDQLDDVPGIVPTDIEVTSSASSLSVSVTAEVSLVFGNQLPTSLFSFTIRNEYPK